MQHMTFLTRISTAALTILLFSSSAWAQDSATKTEGNGLTAEFVYKFLVGEIAGQRGDIGLASAVFYDLAKSSRNPQIAERAAKAAIYGNEPQLALRAASLWSELEPNSPEALQIVTQLTIGAGNLNEAEPHLKKLLTQEETRASVFLYLNVILSRNTDKLAVLKLVQSLAKPYPDLAEAHFAVAHSAWNANKADLALSELKITDKLSPGWEIPALLQGEIRLKNSNEDAANYYQDFLRQYPTSYQVRLAYVKLLVSQKKFREARTEFTPLEKLADNNPDIAVAAGFLSVELKDYAKADEYFQRALNQGYKQPNQLYLYMGQLAEEQNQPDQAIAWYKRVEEGEQYAEAQMRMASVLAKQGKLDEARTLLHQQENLSPDDQVMALQLEANLLSQSGDNQGAYDVLEQAVTSLPNTPELIYDFAMIAEKIGKYEIMEKQLRTLITLKPEFAQAYNALGYTLADRNERLDEASRLIEKALALSPNDYYILDSMGWLQYRLGKLDTASEYLHRAYTAQADPEIAAHLGEVLWQQGKQEEAKKTWAAALHDFPDNELLRNTVKKFDQ
jgi:Flp pilus assembly protein TadD